MRRELPPLNALKAFEVAARHNNFVSAGREMSVSPAAISRHVKLLEAHLGIRLFLRTSSGLRLTQQGADYAKRIEELFDQLSAATAHLRRSKRGHLLVISTLPMFMERCLAPRLARFRSRYPQIELQIEFHYDRIPSTETEVEIYLAYSNGHHPNFHVTKLLEEELFPVCSPELIKGRTIPLAPRDFLGFNLLHDIYLPNDWPLWLSAAGIPSAGLDEGFRFALYSAVIRSAINGLGMAVGHSSMIEEELRSGRLIPPAELRIPAPSSFYMVTTVAAAQTKRVRVFRRWLLQEFGERRAPELRMCPALTVR